MLAVRFQQPFHTLDDYFKHNLSYRAPGTRPIGFKVRDRFYVISCRMALVVHNKRRTIKTQSTEYVSKKLSLHLSISRERVFALFSYFCTNLYFIFNIEWYFVPLTLARVINVSVIFQIYSKNYWDLIPKSYLYYIL